MSFIEELYYGNINPNEKKKMQDSSYVLAMKQFCENEKKLSEQLTDDNLKLFNELINSHDTVTAYNGFENFRIGIILGVRFMTECFKSDVDSVLRDI